MFPKLREDPLRCWHLSEEFIRGSNWIIFSVNIPAQWWRWISGGVATNGRGGEQRLGSWPSDWSVSRYLSRKWPEVVRKVLHCKYRDCWEISPVTVLGLRSYRQGVQRTRFLAEVQRIHFSSDDKNSILYQDQNLETLHMFSRGFFLFFYLRIPR